MTAVKVGDRIKLNSNVKGCILYIGEIHVSKGVFYGVGLDTPDGKNNGSINGITYFTCKENHGMFVRLSQFSKIEEDINAASLNIPNSSVYVLGTQKPETDVKNCGMVSSEVKENLLGNLVDIVKVDNASNDNVKIEINKTMSKGLPVFNASNLTRLNNRPSSILPQNSYMYSNRLTNPQKINNQVALKDSNHGDKILIADSQIKPVSDENISNSKAACNNCISIGKDCEEKIATFQILKKRDREKVMILEKNNKDLQNRLSEAADLSEKFKKEKEKINSDFNAYKETMESMEEAMESITVDKEVAEEELELLRCEVKELKEANEKFVNENKELTSIVNGKGIAIEDSLLINKYRSAIESLGKMIEDLKNTIKSRDEEIELLLDKEISLEIKYDESQNENEKLKKDIGEMKEIVDITSDTEYIIDNLTEKNLYLESKLASLDNRVLELDELNDRTVLNLEDKIKEIKELRFENDLLERNIQGLKMELSSNLNKETDKEDLNCQFRDKIQALEREIIVLKDNLKREQSEKRVSRVVETRRDVIVGYSTQKAIDGKLKDLELRQKVQLSNILKRFLGDTFKNIDVSIDIVEIVLLMDRYLEKISIILSHMADKKHTPCKDAEVMVFHTNLEFLLLYWQDILSQLKRNVDQLDLGDLDSITANTEHMKRHEPRLDIILGWIQKDSFDESRDLNDLAQCVDYFREFLKDKFPHPLFEPELKIKHFIKTAKMGSQCLENNIQLIESTVSTKLDSNIRFKDLSEFMKKITSEIQTKVKSMYTHLINLPKLKLPLENVSAIDEAILLMNHLVQTLSQLTNELMTDKVSLDNFTPRLLEIFHAYAKITHTNSAMTIIEMMKKIRDTINNVSNCLDHGLFEVTGEARKNYVVDSDSIIDKTVRQHRESVACLRRLSVDLEQKEKQVNALNVELVKKTKMLRESSLSTDHMKTKLRKVVEEKEEELMMINDQLLTKEDESKSKDTLISNLKDQISSLTTQISVLESSPVIIEKKELCDVNNKEGYITEVRVLRHALATLSRKLDRVRATSTKAEIKELKPLNITTSTAKVDNCVTKSRTLSFEIYKNLSTIQIVSLSGDVSKCLRDREVSVDLLKFRSGQLKNECSREIPDWVL